MADDIAVRRNWTLRERHDRRFKDLESVRQPLEAAWKDIAEHYAPGRLRLVEQSKIVVPSRKKIIDSEGSFCIRTLASGMHSGMSSPARPWFRLTTTDPALREFGPVKEYVDTVEQRIRKMFASSNTYNALQTSYFDIGLYGQSCAMVVEDPEQHIRIQQFATGGFWFSGNQNGRIDTVYRRYTWTVENVIRRFGLPNVSHTVKNLYDNAKYDDPVVVCHAVGPRQERDTRKIDKANKPFFSDYWEEGRNDLNKMLLESGFDSNPILAPRWETVAEDHYAVQSPCWEALPDVKMLQVQQTRKGEAIDKMVRPPMKGPASMRNNPASILPGSITYVDDTSGGKFEPAMNVNINLRDLKEDIGDTRQRARTATFADLFLMISNMPGIQPRHNFEIAEMREEKMLALGPVLERVQNEQHEPLIDRAFDIGLRHGLFPPPPKELGDQELKVDFISTLAQAQKAVATGGIERLWSFAGSIAAVKPEVLDKLDADQTLDEYADMIGAPPKILVTDEKVKEVRAQRAQAQAQQAAAEQAATLAPAAESGANAAATLAEASDRPGGSQLLDKLGLTGRL